MNGTWLGIPVNYWIILFGALVTYATRFGGYAVLSRFKRIPPRVNVALNAVPAAVITTLVAPALVSHGPAEVITLVICLIAGFRLPMMGMFVLGWVVIVALRAAGL
jgi:Predicted membrane protein